MSPSLAPGPRLRSSSTGPAGAAPVLGSCRGPAAAAAFAAAAGWTGREVPGQGREATMRVVVSGASGMVGRA
ncbi:MAG TPA: hypothetical protein VMU09_07125, partial [Acidimicrobiales bacterium]|nr:hypothetical protein [Acidimicrobiales bacterium]